MNMKVKEMGWRESKCQNDSGDKTDEVPSVTPLMFVKAVCSFQTAYNKDGNASTMWFPETLTN